MYTNTLQVVSHLASTIWNFISSLFGISLRNSRAHRIQEHIIIYIYKALCQVSGVLFHVMMMMILDPLVAPLVDLLVDPSVDPLVDLMVDPMVDPL